MSIQHVQSRWFLGSLLLICMLIVFSSQVSAQASGKKQDEWFGGWRYQFVLGAFSSHVETKVRLDARDQPGTEFSFENDLGLVWCATSQPEIVTTARYLRVELAGSDYEGWIAGSPEEFALACSAAYATRDR